MSNTVFELYRNNTYDLVQSLVVKFSDEAICNNKALEKLGVSVDSDPTTWRYYLNLNGEYHSTNTQMKTISLDNQQEIVLTKETLKTHKKTRNAMRPGKWLFYELFDKYPTQGVLLRGLLYPVDPSVAIPAKDGDILNWDKDLVEQQEHRLIETLCKESMAIFHRWHIDTHLSVGTLYSAAFLINYAKAMYDAVMSARNQSVNTNEAHSYHIWRYLASNGKLERYRPYLTQEQTLWLYREVKYIVNNAGLQETLQSLIDNLLSPRGIRCMELQIAQDTRDLKNPLLEIERKKLNYHNEDLLHLVPMSILGVNEKLSHRIDGDPNNVAEDSAEVTNQSSSILSTRVHTKAIETFIPAEVSPMLDVELTHLLRQWGYLALSGRYLDVVTIREFKSGQEVKLSVRHAYQLYLAMIKISQRIPLTEYGKFGIPAVISHQIPDISHPWIHKELTDNLMRDLKVPDLISSTADFYAEVIRQRQALVDFDLWSQQQLTSDIEAVFHAAINACHRNVKLTLGDEGTKEVDWLNSINPEFINYTPDEAKDLAVTIMVKCCGIDTISDYDKSTVRDRLMELIEELGCYHVRFVANTTDESPYNARTEVDKVNKIITAKMNDSLYYDLGYRFTATKDVVFKEYILPYFIEDVFTTTKKTSEGFFPPENTLTVSTGKNIVVGAMFTQPPLHVIEEEVKTA